MISKEEVQHIAKLARIGLSRKEVEEFQKELSSILNYFEKLKKVNVSKIEITSHSIKIENATREDIENEEFPARGGKKLLDLAPKTKDGYLKTKSIL